MILIRQKPDTVGVFSSLLCLMHCIATPFLFMAQSCAVTGCNDTPIWWRYIDYIFLVVSFFAVYQTTKKTSYNPIKYGLWTSWALLVIVIVNEKWGWLPLNDNLIYVPALALITLHLYNRKYCTCNNTKCCTNEL